MSQQTKAENNVRAVEIQKLMMVLRMYFPITHSLLRMNPGKSACTSVMTPWMPERTLSEMASSMVERKIATRILHAYLIKLKKPNIVSSDSQSIVVMSAVYLEFKAPFGSAPRAAPNASRAESKPNIIFKE